MRGGEKERKRRGFMIYCGFCELLPPVVVVMSGLYDDKMCAPETGNGVGIGKGGKKEGRE